MKNVLRLPLMAMLLVVALVCQETWALAGTTGGLSGIVTDAAGSPVASATVIADSPSQRTSANTDAKGEFVFLGLAPDSYTVTVSKAEYNSASIAGTTVFADNTAQIRITLTRMLKQIGAVTSRSAGSLVKAGITSDTYSVDSTSIQKAGALGGGGNLDSAYSAIASVPGVTVTTGGSGWGQAAYIRGSQQFFTAYEYDGIPVNRAFDNYNSSTESNLGLQELQVYTGSGPASSSAAGTAGFINQVIKTGTYPGSASLNVGLATPSFYHEGRAEIGGASPDRNFSYYVGMSGYNQQFPAFDNTNGATLLQPNGLYGFLGAFTTNVNYAHTNGRGVLPLCDASGSAPATPAQPWITAEAHGSCLIDNPAAGIFGSQAGITDRENILNLHVKIPHKNGTKDDVQFLASSSSMNTSFLTSTNDGGGPGAYTLAVTGASYCSPSHLDAHGAPCAAPNFPFYQDAVVYNLPFGTPIAGQTTRNYFQPSSNPNRAFGAELPPNLRDAIYNDTGVLKVQYTHPIGSSAYLRAYGYTFFSDWTQAGAQSSYNQYLNGIGGPISTIVAANYDLITHTSGGELQFADQFSSKHLTTLTANYARASVTRFNNTGFVGGASPIGYIAQNGNSFTCYDPSSGAAITCLPGGKYQSDAITGPTGANPAADAAGAKWVTLWDGEARGSLNHVQPQFTSVSLTDEFRPNDKLLINLGLRYEKFRYLLDNSNLPQTAFYAGLINQYVCQNNANGTLDTVPLRPGQPPPAKVNYEAACPTGYSHPNFSTASPSSYTLADLAPRFSFTYTVNPDTIYRGSISRNTQPPISASLQYLNSSGNNLNVWNATLPLGFNSPFHPIPAMSATQADLSYEHHIRGTDVSLKVSPFFNYTNGYQQQSFIGPNFVTQAPVGAFRSKGVELAVSKGDFRRNGLSGSLALTLTDAKVQYQDRYYGKNQIHTANTVIGAFNALTKGGGGSPCYKTSSDPTNSVAGIGDPLAACGPNDIANPYYGVSPQALMNENGWYAPGNTGLDVGNSVWSLYFDTPLTASAILNYRKDKFAITPSFQLIRGSSYGGPYDVSGLDPRTCNNNISNTKAGSIAAADPAANPNQCDYLNLSAAQAGGAAPQLFIPNPQTGFFAKPGQFKSPFLLLANVALSYDVSSKVTANLTLSNIYHSCFGGDSEPWTKAYPPQKNVCSYSPAGWGGTSGGLGSYISNYYNGTSASDKIANGTTPYPWQLQSYQPTPSNLANALPLPFTAYFSLTFKI